MHDSMRSKAELHVLRALISLACDASEPNSAKGGVKTLLDQLSGYAWSDEEHRMVYECLRNAPSLRVVPLRERLAAEATRMGHPDVDWDRYFAHAADDADIADLIRCLRTTPP